MKRRDFLITAAAAPAGLLAAGSVLKLNPSPAVRVPFECAWIQVSDPEGVQTVSLRWPDGDGRVVIWDQANGWQSYREDGVVIEANARTLSISCPERMAPQVKSGQYFQPTIDVMFWDS